MDENVHFEDPDLLKSWLTSHQANFLWTDDRDIEIISRMLGVNINVISARNKSDKNPKCVSIGNLPKTQAITIINWGQIHFDAVINADTKEGSDNSITDIIKRGDPNELKKVILKGNGDDLKDLRAEVRALKIDQKKNQNAKENMQKQYSEMEDAVRDSDEWKMVTYLKNKKKADIVKTKEDNLVVMTKETNLVAKTSPKESPNTDVFKNPNPNAAKSQNPNVANSCEVSKSKPNVPNSFQNISKGKTDDVVNDEDDDNDGQFNCEDCDHQTNSKERLNTHIQRKHTRLMQPSYKCDVCGTEMEDNSSLNRHIAKEHPNLRICRYYLEARCLFNDNCIFKHVRRAIENYICNICEVEFNAKSILMFHRKNEHLDKMLLCRHFFKGICKFEDENCWYRHTIKKILWIFGGPH